jgi:hypothetical protein
MNDTLQFSFNYSNTSTKTLADNLVPKITLGCLLSCLAIFTVCGNILVLYAIQTEKNLRTVSNLFILSLAVADLAVGLFVMPLSAATIIAGRWPFSPMICKMWLSIDYVARYDFQHRKDRTDKDACIYAETWTHDSLETKTTRAFILVYFS